MALRPPITTTTNANPQASMAVQLHLPAPQSFDVLPPLHELLARVEAYHQQNLASSDVGGDDTTGLANDQSDSNADPVGSAYAELQPLNPRELPVAVSEIKARIRNALRELEKLPDMDHSVAQQEQEIRELETRIQKQQEMLWSVAGLAKTIMSTSAATEG